MERKFDQYVTDRPPSTLTNTAIWSAVLIAGWLIYELTAQPALAAATVCIKFGWNDFLTGLWLRRIDPNRGRSLTCFWLYLAWGLWKMSVTGIVLCPVVSCFAALVNGPPLVNIFPTMLLGALITALICFGLSSLATYVTVFIALRNRVKVWLGSIPIQARRERLWPPLYFLRKPWNVNNVDTLLITSLAFAFVFLFVAPLIIVAPFVPLDEGAAIILMVAHLLFLVATVISLFLIRGFLAKRIMANSPIECWGAEPPDENCAYNTHSLLQV